MRNVEAKCTGEVQRQRAFFEKLIKKIKNQMTPTPTPICFIEIDMSQWLGWFLNTGMVPKHRLGGVVRMVHWHRFGSLVVWDGHIKELYIRDSLIAKWERSNKN
jgi:hypothetical protein